MGMGVFAPEASLFGGVVYEDERGTGAFPSQGFELGKVEARFGDGVYEHKIKVFQVKGELSGDKEAGVGHADAGLVFCGFQQVVHGREIKIHFTGKLGFLQGKDGPASVVFDGLADIEPGFFRAFGFIQQYHMVPPGMLRRSKLSPTGCWTDVSFSGATIFSVVPLCPYYPPFLPLALRGRAGRLAGPSDGGGRWPLRLFFFAALRAKKNATPLCLNTI